MVIHPSHSVKRNLIRAFIAVDVGPLVRAALRPTVEKLRRQLQGLDITWVAEANWHLTVKFLGEIDWLTTGVVGKAMQEVAGSVPAFSLEFAGLQAFPPLRPPRVLAVGVGVGAEELAALHTALDARMQTLGASPENRTFRAHLTLARIRGKRGVEALPEVLEGYQEKAFGVTDVDEVILYESELRRDGSRYAVLATGALA